MGFIGSRKIDHEKGKGKINDKKNNNAKNMI